MTAPSQPNMPSAVSYSCTPIKQQPINQNQCSPLFAPRPQQHAYQPVPLNTPFTPRPSPSPSLPCREQPVQQPPPVFRVSLPAGRQVPASLYSAFSTHLPALPNAIPPPPSPPPPPPPPSLHPRPPLRPYHIPSRPPYHIPPHPLHSFSPVSRHLPDSMISFTPPPPPTPLPPPPPPAPRQLPPHHMPPHSPHLFSPGAQSNANTNVTTVPFNNSAMRLNSRNPYADMAMNLNDPTARGHAPNPNAGTMTPCPPRQQQQRAGRMLVHGRGQPAPRSESPQRPIPIVRPSVSFEERHQIETEAEAERTRLERKAVKAEQERVRNDGWNRIQEERKTRKEAKERVRRSKERKGELEAGQEVDGESGMGCGLFVPHQEQIESSEPIAGEQPCPRATTSSWSEMDGLDALE
ncbi:hypothetical protein C0992_007852, partial [Termitomyces sp. T32_za158]